MLHIKEKHRDFWKWAIVVVAALFLIGTAIFFIIKFLISSSNDRLAADDTPTPDEQTVELDFTNFIATETDESSDLNNSENQTDSNNSGVSEGPNNPSTKSPKSSSTNPGQSTSKPNNPSQPIIQVSSIKVSPSNLSLTRGHTANLTATISPENATDKAISWSSSNTNVATVTNSGRVVALHKGSAIITAKTANGNCTATADVTVVNPELKVSPWIYPSTITANGVTSQGVATGANASGGSEDYIIKIEVYRNGVLVRTGHNRVDVAGSGEYYAKWTVDDAEEGTRTGTTETVTVP